MPPLPVTAGQALLTSIGNQARALYTIDNNPVLDPSGFIATEDPAPIFQRPAKQLARAICRTWARQQGASTNPAADRLYGSACGPYLEAIGEKPSPGEIGTPFTGGQCAGVTYQVSWTRNTPGEAASPQTTTAVGPLGFSRALGSDEGNVDCGVPGRTFNRYTLTSPGGNVNLASGCGVTATNISVTPTGGGANNCGSPPPDYEPPRRPIALPPITPIFIDLPDIGPIDVNIDMFPDGTINLCSDEVQTCVEITGPDGDPDGGGDDGGGGVDGGDLVPDGGTAGGPADTGDGGTAAGDAPPGQELVGIRVEVLESPTGVNTYDRISTTVFRGIGYIRMGYPGRLALDMGGAAVISPQFFLAPVRGLTSWEVRANNGFINRVTPFYRELPS